uniref:Uncharacterized protein n=1 Tax=Physcomitrium patens TaxID=3218 RepID=A0A2K1KFY3_PHYPA|nr:hypothetical protein PHYPA_009068 [Physcomitrium patens]
MLSSEKDRSSPNVSYTRLPSLDLPENGVYDFWKFEGRGAGAVHTFAKCPDSPHQLHRSELV